MTLPVTALGDTNPSDATGHTRTCFAPRSATTIPLNRHVHNIVYVTLQLPGFTCFSLLLHTPTLRGLPGDGLPVALARAAPVND